MSGDMDDMEMSEGSGDMEGMDGAMVMQEMPNGLALVGGETVVLEPGSYHVMLLDLAAPLVDGEQFDVTLDFAEADDVTIEVEVSETAP
jgi:copper(I)-binding protein